MNIKSQSDDNNLKGINIVEIQFYINLKGEIKK